MTMATRTLVIHGGFAKTGTSALQVGFARNRDWLLAQGVDYLEGGHFDHGLRGAVSSGNAVDVAYHLARLEDRPERIDELVARLAASSGERVLLSSEFFQSARRPQLQALVDAVRAAGFDVQAVFLVRSYYEWLWSAYVQNVKNHAVTASFADWAKASGLAHMFAGTLELYDTILGAANVRVLSYDGMRGDVLGGFLKRVFGIEAPEGELDVPSEINRSLTDAELGLLRRFNTLRNSEADGTLLSNLLITASPRSRAASATDRTVLAWLRDEVAADLARINARIAGGKIRLAQGPADDRAEAPSGPPDRPIVALALQTFALLADTRRELAQLRAAYESLLARVEQSAAATSATPAAPGAETKGRE